MRLNMKTVANIQLLCMRLLNIHILILAAMLWLNQVHANTSAPAPDAQTSVSSERYYQTTYQGKIAYYVPPRCCDIPSALFNQDWKLICYPSGGFAGGDGKCPNFIFDESIATKITPQNEASKNEDLKVDAAKKDTHKNNIKAQVKQSQKDTQ